MSVEFNEPEFAMKGSGGKKRSLLSTLVIKWGLARTDKEAQNALLVLALFIFALAGIVFWIAIF